MASLIPVMDRCNEKAKEQLQVALEDGYQRKSGKIYDWYSGSWQPRSKCRYKLQFISDPVLQFKVGEPGFIIAQPTPAMQALLKHKKDTGREPAIMRVTDQGRAVSFYISKFAFLNFKQCYCFSFFFA